MIACNHQGTHRVWQLWLFYQLPWHKNSHHCDVISNNKLRCCLINIYDELVWNVVLKDFIGNFVKKLWSLFNPKRPGNYWPWCCECAMWKVHLLVQWSNPWSVTLKSIYLPNLFGFARIKPFSTPETTWMLTPAPAVCRFMSIECNLT